MKPDEWIKSQKNGIPASNVGQVPPGAQMPPPGSQQITLEPGDLEDVACECGNEYFEAVAKVKRLSPLHPKNMDHQERFFPLRVLVCKKCGKEKPGVNF